MVQTLKILVGVVVLFFMLATHAQQVPTCTLTAAPTEALGSANVTLTWSSTGATTCVASGAWSGVKECSGSGVMSGVNSTRTYTLSARAAQGKVVAKWTKPTTNQDNTPATITGFKLYIANAPSELDTATPLTFPASTLEHVFWRNPGDVSASIKSVRGDGVESAFSQPPQSKAVTVASTTCKAVVTVNPRPKAPTLTISWLKGLFTGEDNDS